MAKKQFPFKFSWPKLPKFNIRWPFSSPVKLTKVQDKLFSTVKGKKKFNWRKFGKICLWGLGAFILLLIFLFAWFAKDLPTPEKIKSVTSSGSTKLFDRNGKELYTISGDEKRIVVDQSQIAPIAVQATVSLEDHGFYTEPGVNLRGILRSILANVTSGQKSQGGSTITQQYVRLAILNDTNKNYVRKIKEIILAIEVSFLYSKDQIMTMYLNEIPYGGNLYGIEAASEGFFGVHAKDLTLAQAATLAALPQQPTTLSPYGDHTDLLIERRNTALDSMVQLNFITQAQANDAKQTKLAIIPKSESITAPHFVLYVKQWLVDYFTQQLGDQTLAEQKVESGGLSVTTTLDIDKQKIAEASTTKQANTTLKSAGANDTGLVVIDPKTGQIISMVGSVDYYQPQFGSFNVTTTSHQPGSSFKPVVYATGFKGTLDPASTLFDLKTNFGGNYTPNNYDGKFRGPVSIRYALGNSLNIPAVKVMALSGIDGVLKTASDLGITTLTQTQDYGLSLALGAGEVTPLEMAGAYGVFANGGVLVPTTPIMKIADGTGKVLYDQDNLKVKKQVLDPQIAYEISNILSDVNAKKPEFGNLLNVLSLSDRPAASKTGTTDDFKDAWTIGYTPDYVTAVWVGNNDHTQMKNHSIGAIAAAPLWHDVMVQFEKGLPVAQFDRPAGIQTVTVDKLSNKLTGPGSDPISDVFASWQIPTTNDDVHQQIRVCKENGLLAGADISDELATIKTFTYVKSESPSNPNWENPVRAWAQANGYNNAPPTQNCVKDGSTQPTIAITNPSNGGTVSGTFTIAANASAASGVNSVQFFIDNVSIATITSAPYQTSYSTTQLSNGQHIITATVTSNSGATNSTQSTFTSSTVVAPNDLTSFNGAAGPGAGKATLTWVNPTTGTSPALVRVYVYNDTTLVLIKTVDVTNPSTGTVITGLPAGATRFVAKTVDSAGDESTGVKIVLTIT